MTRASIQKDSSGRWIAGSSPAMTKNADADRELEGGTD
jgi:hypothetical protein